jgi:hypothetical protein
MCDIFPKFQYIYTAINYKDVWFLFYFTDKSTEDGVYEVYIGNLAKDVTDVSLLS